MKVRSIVFINRGAKEIYVFYKLIESSSYNAKLLNETVF